MKSCRINCLILSLIAILSVFFFTGCGMYEIKSVWRDREITIDGIDVDNEWNNARYFFEQEKVTVGFLNDGDDLYVRLSAGDRNMQRQLLMLGFTVWFDTEGGKKKTLGIHFPVGMQDGAKRMMLMDNNTTRDEASDQIQIMLEGLHDEIEIIGPGKDESVILVGSDTENYGIDMDIAYSKGNLVYELRIPLKRNDVQPYGIGNDIPESVAVGLETGKIDINQMRTQAERQPGSMGGRGGAGGMGGKGGGAGGRGGAAGRGGMGERTDQMIESLELWVKADLAAEPM